MGIGRDWYDQRGFLGIWELSGSDSWIPSVSHWNEGRSRLGDPAVHVYTGMHTREKGLGDENDQSVAGEKELGDAKGTARHDRKRQS